MTNSSIAPGLYRLHWKAGGGTSLASVGMKEDGQRWFAPTNWISVPSFDWAKIERVETIVEGSDTEERPAGNLIAIQVIKNAIKMWPDNPLVRSVLQALLMDIRGEG